MKIIGFEIKQKFGFQIIWTAVESLISEGGIDEEEEGISGEDECDEFVCKGGQICMEEVSLYISKMG